MKKIFSLLLSIILMSSFAFGQDAAKAKADSKAPKAKQATPKDAKTEAAKSSKDQKATEAKTANPAGKTKKDGTPDMRYKDNKEASKPAPKLKKDGTPDMRYKQNKEAAKKK